MDDDTKRPRREPRLGQTPAREKAETLRGVLAKEIARLRKLQPTRAKESPAVAALRPQRDEILALLREGWTANAIATEIANAHEGTYSVETLRNAIRRIASEGSRTMPTRTQDGRSAPASTSTGAKSSVTSHAGFAEDPR